MAIYFFQENIQFDLPEKRKIKKWLNLIASQENFDITTLNYIFCDDATLHEINTDYLNHDTLTDIISFDNSEIEKTIEGDIFISIERISENAKTLRQNFNEELLRVISHGLFHLCGYDDHLQRDINIMRMKEDAAISLYKTLRD